MNTEIATPRRHPEARPGQILEAALEVLGEHGLAGARLEEIARRAGISKGTIYLYFDSKDAVFRAVVKHTLLEEMDRIAGTKHTGTAEERVRSLIGEFWAFVRTPEFQAVYRLVAGELHRFPELTRFYSREVSGRVSNALARNLQEGIDAGEFHEMDVRVTAQMPIALCIKQSVWCERRKLLGESGGKSDDEVLGEVLDFCLRAIRI
ncbi:MAG TPA: TetR/AcrR family transcriptional regulator [Longimicrobiaceae bacterium]|nr:TetR/AcrR family transcriptional regulator [Longimicrobiaceae bacterium]